MKAPLRLDVDEDGAAIYDADGVMIVEEPGPEATWEDLWALVNAYNAFHDVSRCPICHTDVINRPAHLRSVHGWTGTPKTDTQLEADGQINALEA